MLSEKTVKKDEEKAVFTLNVKTKKYKLKNRKKYVLTYYVCTGNI